MAAIGGYMAYAFRMQLALSWEHVPLFGLVSAAEYNALVTNHGTVMIFWVAMPVLIAAFGNYLIPLMIGCDDMVFPRLNRLSYQVFLISAIVLIASFFVDGGAFGGAWTAYPPLSAKAEYSLTPLGSTLWVVAVGLEFVAFLLGGINFITTMMNSRAPGMRLWDIPIVVWMIVVASILFMASVGPLLSQGLSCSCLTSSWGLDSLTRLVVATQSCGSTCFGSLDTPKSTSCFCLPWGLSPR